MGYGDEQGSSGEPDFEAELARRVRRQMEDAGPPPSAEPRIPNPDKFGGSDVVWEEEAGHVPFGGYETLGLRPPRELHELGIPGSLVQDLTLRRALFEGRTSTVGLAANLCVTPQLMNRVVEEMREMRYLEVQGLEGRDYILALTEYGREQAAERMRLSRYAGAVPVSLVDYTRVIWAQQSEVRIDPAVMRDAFSDLVVNQRLLDELGPALLTRGAMFLYGPPGTGKSSIAERLNRIHDDLVVVPRSVEVDSQIISVYDPVVHEAVADQPADLDPRWVLCKRPSIITGGELQREALDLQFEANNGVYLAPLQMQANNGVLVIDDFGRQVMTPAELLNRWIVPLDRRVDYLSLSYGVKFAVPFDVKVVLSTNLEPATLGDEAFFRRIQNKIFIKPIADDEFDEVLRRAVERHGIEVSGDAYAYLRLVSREMGDGDLRPYLPNEVCKILKAVCEYKSEPLVLNRQNIDAVANIYFTQEVDTSERWNSGAVSGGTGAFLGAGMPPGAVVQIVTAPTTDPKEEKAAPSMFTYEG